MAYPFPQDLQKLVREQMTAGEYGSEDEFLRDALRALDEHRRTVVYDDPEVLAGIQRGLDEMKKGLGQPFEQFDAEFRAKHGIPPDA
jgi:Arc/MetJ-type ribon-helix-helix transcriptional regulator